MSRRPALFWFFLLASILSLKMWPPEAYAQETQAASQPGAQQREPWEIGTRPANWKATSNLQIENRCKRRHHFDVLPENVSFMHFLSQTQNVDVEGHRTATLPVQFDTTGMQPGNYAGQVVVKCLDCSKEPTCTQDREFLPVHMAIASAATAPAVQPVAQTPVQGTPGCTVNCANCTSGVTKDCREFQAVVDQKWLASQKAFNAYWNAQITANLAWFDAEHQMALAVNLLIQGDGMLNYKLALPIYAQALDAYLHAQQAIAIAVAGDATLQTLAQAKDQAYKELDEARQALADCQQRLQQQCGPQQGSSTGPAGGVTGGPSSGGPAPTTSSQGCQPAEDCDKLKKAWEEAQRQAAIAQALADQAKANQSSNNSQSAQLQQEALGDQAFADHMTETALKWLDLAEDAEKQAAVDRARAQQWPAGSENQAGWEAQAARDQEWAQFYREQYERLEAEEREYDAKAVQAATQAAALQGTAGNAQAAADAAAAAAAAAEKAYKDCLERQKQAAKENCSPGTAGGTTSAPTPGTGGGNPTGGGENPSGPTGGGGKPAGTGAGSGTGTGSEPGGQPDKGKTSTTKKKGKRCEWRVLKVEFGPYTLDTKERSDFINKIGKALQKFLEKSAPSAATTLKAALKSFTITRIAQNVYITYILVEIDEDTGAETIIDMKTILLEDKDAIDFWGNVDTPEAEGARRNTIERLKPRGGCPK